MQENLTLPEALDKWVKLQPNKRLWTFLDDDGNETDSVTYQELDDKSRALATALLSGSKLKSALVVGDRVLLVYPPSLHFIVAFVACLRAGLVAVPVYPPDPRRLGRDLAAFAGTARSCGASVALTSTSYDHVKKVTALKQRLTGGDARWPDHLEWVATDGKMSLPSGSSGAAVADAAVAPEAATQGLAFLQYTSGSTSEPKGVCVAHRNLAHNLALIVKELAADQSTIVASWLPQYHDMGLVGSYLGVLYCGGSGYYMSPLSFIRSPPTWMMAISRYRATHMQAPNFAYALTVRKWRLLRSKPPLDLACVRHMINGAEPVDFAAIDAFEATFAEHGLQRGVIFPTYGLAEHTVFVTSNGRRRLRVSKRALEVERTAVPVSEGSADRAAGDGAVSDGVQLQDAEVTLLAGCGVPDVASGVQVVVVDPETSRAVPDSHVGEIWVRSPSKACGYWAMPTESLRDFCAELTEEEDDATASALNRASTSASAESTGQAAAAPTAASVAWAKGYLRTGDEGFVNGSEIFVCGRIKDLIIIGGRNHYPQDIEKTAERAAPDEVRPGCSAAFSVPANADPERLVLTCEVRDGAGSPAGAAALAALAGNIRAAVVVEHQVSVWHLLLLPARSNRKTTSGKIARRHCRREYLEGGMKPAYELKSPDRESGQDTGERPLVAPDLAAATAASAAVPGHVLHDVDIGGPVIAEEGTGAAASSSGGTAATLSDEELLGRLQTLLGCMLDGNTSPDPDTPLYTMGATSVAMAQFSGALQQEYNANVSMQVLDDDHTTLRTLVPLVRRGRASTGPGLAAAASVGASSGPVPPRPQGIEEREQPDSCERCITNWCPCCLCLLGCACR